MRLSAAPRTPAVTMRLSPVPVLPPTGTLNAPARRRAVPASTTSDSALRSAAATSGAITRSAAAERRPNTVSKGVSAAKCKPSMRTVGLADPVVDDHAHQLGQRRRPVARAAERGRERRHQMREGIAESLPAAMDLEEGLDLEHGVDALVLGALRAGAEEPAVDCLTFGAARLDRLGEARAGMGGQEADQPQLERMHARDVALVGQVEGARCVAPVQCAELRLADARAGQALAP